MYSVPLIPKGSKAAEASLAKSIVADELDGGCYVCQKEAWLVSSRFFYNSPAQKSVPKKTIWYKEK